MSHSCLPGVLHGLLDSLVLLKISDNFQVLLEMHVKGCCGFLDRVRRCYAELCIVVVVYLQQVLAKLVPLLVAEQGFLDQLFVLVGILIVTAVELSEVGIDSHALVVNRHLLGEHSKLAHVGIDQIVLVGPILHLTLHNIPHTG